MAKKLGDRAPKENAHGIKTANDELEGQPKVEAEMKGSGEIPEDRDERDPDSFGFRRTPEGNLVLNPRSRAGLFGGHKKGGWGIVELVNNTHTVIELPAMEKRKLMVNGTPTTEWYETGEKIVVLALQAVEYFEHAINAPRTPFVIKETPDDSEYTLTDDQAIEHLKKFPELVFEEASEAYRQYTNEMRPKVLNFIAKHGAEVRAAEKKRQSM